MVFKFTADCDCIAVAIDPPIAIDIFVHRYDMFEIVFAHHIFGVSGTAIWSGVLR